MTADEWLTEHRRKMARAKVTACPNCGERGTAEVDNGGAGGMMLNCACGARCRVDDWNAGRITLLRNKDGTYSYIDAGRPVPPHGSGP